MICDAVRLVLVRTEITSFIYILIVHNYNMESARTIANCLLKFSLILIVDFLLVLIELFFARCFG